MPVRVALIALLGIAPFFAHGFQVLPRVSDVDRKLANLGDQSVADPLAQFAMRGVLPLLKNPVHEAITLAAVGCEVAPSEEKQCLTLEAIAANRVLLYGVRWPDDPPFALDRRTPPSIAACDVRITVRSTSQPICWLKLFKDAGVQAKAQLAVNPNRPAFGPGHHMVYRSHFGDLQFFHAMAAYDGERAGDTQARMKTWAQFLWGLALGQVAKDQYIRTLGFADLALYFPGDITATNLFATGIVEVRKDLHLVALGALLHMVQDSFSQAHVYRLPEGGGQCPQMPRFAKPGKIAQFYSYAQQDGHLHDREDTFNALGLQTLQSSPSVVDASRAIMALWKDKAPWAEVAQYFDCAMELQNPDASAGPGPFVAPEPAPDTGYPSSMNN
jgi:hypothetical protein